MITPEQASNISRYTDKDPSMIIRDIDENIKQNHGLQPYESAILDYELSWPIRDQIALWYIKAGWDYVYHDVRPTDEAEQKRKTVFYFSKTKIQHVRGMCLITKNYRIQRIYLQKKD